MTSQSDFARCADLLLSADAMLITAGAGMGVMSGLPDFRGSKGFWEAYPALGRSNLRFDQVASPEAFVSRPEIAWGFYGHRLALYRATPPNGGFAILKALANQLPLGAFVATSNVDGHFQKAGFPAGRVWECHGSLNKLQCIHGCQNDVWAADNFVPEVDESACRLLNPLPHCQHCGATARPNVLMFGDWNWINRDAREQEWRFAEWHSRSKRLVVVEIGAGFAISTIRHISQGAGAPVIRINLREAELDGIQGVSLAADGMVALQGIWDAM